MRLCCQTWAKSRRERDIGTALPGRKGLLVASYSVQHLAECKSGRDGAAILGPAELRAVEAWELQLALGRRAALLG